MDEVSEQMFERVVSEKRLQIKRFFSLFVGMEEMTNFKVYCRDSQLARQASDLLKEIENGYEGMNRKEFFEKIDRWYDMSTKLIRYYSYHKHGLDIGEK